MARKPPTKNEFLWLGKVASLGCVVCGYSECEIHHLRFGMGMGMRNSHYNAVGLCIDHHRGKNGIHAGAKTFAAKYGSEAELLQKVYDQLGDPLS